MTGYSQMPRIQATSLTEISAHSWSLYWLCRSIKARRIVELGVRSGDSTRALLAAAMDLDATLHSFDEAGDAYHAQKVTEKFGITLDWARWECVQGDSAYASSYWDFSTVDFLFVDTDHSLQTTRREIEAWAPKMLPGGIMAFHDVSETEPGRNGVKPAMMEFLALNPNWHYEFHEHTQEGDNGLGFMVKP